jgi:hypothetical protein
MNNERRKEYLTRDHILKLLSDDDVAAVSTVESATRLGDGDEFIDLENLASGVQRAPQASTPMGRVLPKKSVPPATWSKIVAELPARSGSRLKGVGA